MLSTDLQCLADQLAPYLGDGMELAPQAVRAFHRVISDMAFRARAMEAHAMPAPARSVVPEGDNVVHLWDERRTVRHGLRSLANPIDSGPDLPGGAA